MDGLIIDGKYRVVRQIGAGGMGAVYEAVHTGTGKRVALKVILSAELASDSDMVVRFQREARAAGAIDTQHIVQVFDTGCDPTTKHPFMVMEYLAGEDLAHVVRRVGPLPPDVALRVTIQAATGLQKAHDAGVIHRDIKPANIYLARREAGEIIVKVLDFGIAKVAMDQLASMENAALTRTGNMLGSPIYMSPEQAKGLRSISHQTDVWSLGVVLYEALCGRAPNAQAESLGQLIISICSEQPIPVQDLAPWVAPEIARIVHRALQIDTARRYQSMQEMIDAMRMLLPHGSTVQEPMIGELTPQLRAYVAPRFESSQSTNRQSMPNMLGGTNIMPTTPAPIGGTPTPNGMGMGMPGGMQRIVSTDNAAAHAISQNGVTGSSRDLGPAPRSSRAPLVIGASILGIAIATGVLVGARQYRRAHQPVEIPSATAAATTVATLSSPSASASTSSTTTTTIIDMKATRTVRVAVEPPNAVVEVDGAKVDVVNGTVPIEGVPGSVHKVKLTLGKKEAHREVFLTDVGARPEKIELGGGATTGPATTASHTTTTTAGAVVTKPTTTASTRPGIERKTDEFGPAPK